LLQAIPKLAFGSNIWNRFSDASPRFIYQNTFNGRSNGYDLGDSILKTTPGAQNDRNHF
jgi:hypothetical protein